MATVKLSARIEESEEQNHH